MLVSFRVLSLAPGKREYIEHDRMFDLDDVTVVDRATGMADVTGPSCSCWVYFRDGPHCQIVGLEAERFLTAFAEHHAAKG